MKKYRKILVPGCYRVLDRRLKCGIAVASYTVIEREKSEGFEVQRGRYASEETISMGIQYLDLQDSTKDVGDIRKKVGAESIECACALYGGIVFMLDTEILSVWHDLPEGYALVLFDIEGKKNEGRLLGEIPEKIQIELISHSLSQNLKGFSETLAKYRGDSKFWEERKEITDQSFFWGTGEDGRGFSVIPLNALHIQNHEILEIATLGLHMVNTND